MVFRTTRWKGLAALVAAMGGIFAACSSSGTSDRPVGSGCLVASDCTDPLVCAYQRCHAQCVTSKDCAQGQRCVGSNYPKLGVCLFQDESDCERNSDCAR